MVRPKQNQPTPGELEILKVIWRRGASTVREVMETLKNGRAYTSVMSLMNVMADKGLLKRKPKGKAYVYAAGLTRKKTLSMLLGDVLKRGFEGSPGLLVSHLLNQANPSEEELKEIRRVIKTYEQEAQPGR